MSNDDNSFGDNDSTDELETKVMPRVKSAHSERNPFGSADRAPFESSQDDVPTMVLPPVEGRAGEYKVQGLNEKTEIESFTALKEFDPKISCYQLLSELDALDEKPEEVKKSPWPWVAGAAVVAVVLGIGGYALFGGDDEEVVKDEPVAEKTTEAPEKSKDKEGFSIPDIFDKKTEEPTESASSDEDSEDSKEKEDPKVEDQKPKTPEGDDVSKIVKTADGTELHNFKDANMVPYEKFTDKSKGQPESDSLTGNNYNDEYQAYRMNLGERHKGSLSPETYGERQVRDAMNDAVEKSGIGISVPDKPDYKNARLMSSGYTLWNISDGYVLVMGDGQAKAIISPKEKDDKLTKAAVDSSETLIPQRYADRNALSFGTVNKAVGGSQNPKDNPEEWQ